MLERFAGEAGRRLLTDALGRQPLMRGVTNGPASVAECCEFTGIQAGAVLVEQGGPGNDLYFIITGSFTIMVNGREIARALPEQHVGEMALIDPKARRSATVVALEDSVVARISEPGFAALGDENPVLWRNLACDLSDRLRKRNDFVRQRNHIPRIFVGSSTESLEIANSVQLGLARDPVIVTVWTNGVFGASEFPIEALERVAVESDFAVIVLGPDDRVVSRKKENLAPRDNVILELGLFIGAAGRRRVFLLKPAGFDVKIPTDVLGITPVRYSVDPTLEPIARVDMACSEMRAIIARLGPR
jgi:CRP/FNR family cyclic AMP-dependent transcriptional regulator